MAFNLPPPPTSNDPKDPAFRDWFYKLQKAFSTLGSFLFTNLDFTGSNITSIVTRNHADLQNLNTASYTHLTATQATDLTDGGDSTLHYHATDRDLANATGTLDETNGGTGNSTYTTGDILYASASNTLSKLPIGTSGQSLLVSGGVPAWGAASSSVKIYEPVSNGFDEALNYYSEGVPAIMTDSSGDIMMAWGGDYTT